MLTRIVVGVVAALFAVGMLAIRFTPVFPIVVAFFAVMAAFELERVIGVKNKAIHIISLILQVLYRFTTALIIILPSGAFLFPRLP